MGSSALAPHGGPARTRVLVVDSHKTFADLVLIALTNEPDLVCVGAAQQPAAARIMVAQLDPDVVLMDVNLNSEDGLALAAELLANRPDLRVVVLTAHSDAQLMRRAARAGACALLHKDGGLPELVDTLRHARAGGFRVHPALLHALVTEDLALMGAPRPPTLSPREQRVLELLDAGRHVQGISKELDISVHTCRGYVKSLLAKLDAHSQLEAVAVARANGLVGGTRLR